MRSQNKPKKTRRSYRANMAKIKEAKPQSGPLEKPSVSEVVRATVRAKVRAVKPYLRVPSLLPDPPPPHPQDPSQEGSEEPTETALPKAEKLYKNRLYNQSGVSAWYVYCQFTTWIGYFIQKDQVNLNIKCGNLETNYYAISIAK